MEWIKASERLPKDDSNEDYSEEYIIRIKGDNPRSGWIHAEYVSAEDMREMREEYIEWLDESTPTKEQIEAEAERQYPDIDTLSAYERIILKNERAAFIKGASLSGGKNKF